MSKVPRRDIAAILSRRSLKAGISKKFGREIAAYLLDSGRTSELDPILRDIQLAWADAGYVEAIVSSARPLDKKTRTEIAAKLRLVYPGAKKIIITEEIDPDVVGGARIELATQQLDLSVRAKLNKFKQLTVGGE